MTVTAPPAMLVDAVDVYVVDDDPGMRQTVIEILALAGISAQGFGSGAAVPAPHGQVRPDLAVVDQRLPDTTGIDLSGRLKSEDPDLAVVLLTGYASADNAIAAVGVVDDYLIKPVPPDDLLRSVRAALDRSRLRRENRRLVTRLQEMNASLEATVVQRTRELEEAHERAMADQVIKERLQAQAERERMANRLHQAQRLESLGQLAGGVAHDFNNLLAVILTCTGFVAEATAGDESVRADVEQIRAAAERAARLTRQLLIFGRRDQANIEVLDLSAIVNDVRNLLTRTIGEDIALTVRAADGLPPISADRGQIEQVLVNLAVNARDAMPEGGTLTIALGTALLDEEYARGHPQITPGRYVELSVSDTGVGMPPEVTSRIFEPFFTTKEPGKGTGLGLATVHGIIAAAGGSLSVYSEPGMGTTFRVFFPPAAGQAALAVEPPDAEAIRGRGETVLVVEDEPAVREITARILRRNGYSVLEAASGPEALELIVDRQFDVLLTDLVMPQIPGTDLAQRIRETHPGVGVMFMSGYSQDVLGPRGAFEDGVPLIQKPFAAAELLKAVRAVITARPLPAPGPVNGGG
jgi:signal transduction histidine kinase